MKRCPKCNQTFDEGWLSFCTNDGTTLVEEPTSSSDMMKTIMAPPPPPVSRPNDQANWSSPSGGIGAGQFPAPPPSYAAGPQQGLALASMICGIFSMTIGWCCSTGLIASPVALGLGIYSLIQNKNNPDKFGGKTFAIVGIVTASLYLVLIAIFFLIYGVAIFMGGLK